MPARLRIWEVDCTLLDAVLALSFDTEELLNCCFGAGVPIAACPSLARSHRVRVAVHRACHENNALSRLIERRLDYVHRRAAWADTHDGAALQGADLTATPDLGARLWALACDPSAEASTVRARVAAALTQTGYELLAREVEATMRGALAVVDAGEPADAS